MFIPNPYFKNVPKFGNLQMDHIFLENECPILFTCKNGPKLYLCVCRRISHVQKWVISEINISILEQMIYDKISIHDAFLKGNGYSCIAKWAKNYKNTDYDIVKAYMLADSDLPSANIFLNDKDDSLNYLNEVRNRLSTNMF